MADNPAPVTVMVPGWVRAELSDLAKQGNTTIGGLINAILVEFVNMSKEDEVEVAVLETEKTS